MLSSLGLQEHCIHGKSGEKREPHRTALRPWYSLRGEKLMIPDTGVCLVSVKSFYKDILKPLPSMPHFSG